MITASGNPCDSGRNSDSRCLRMDFSVNRGEVPGIKKIGDIRATRCLTCASVLPWGWGGASRVGIWGMMCDSRLRFSCDL